MKLNCQAHQKSIDEKEVNHLLQFAVHEEDLEVTEGLYSIRELVVVSYSTPTRDVHVEGYVTGFEYALSCEDPYASCTVMIKEK